MFSASCSPAVVGEVGPSRLPVSALCQLCQVEGFCSHPGFPSERLRLVKSTAFVCAQGFRASPSAWSIRRLLFTSRASGRSTASGPVERFCSRQGRAPASLVNSKISARGRVPAFGQVCGFCPRPGLQGESQRLVKSKAFVHVQRFMASRSVWSSRRFLFALGVLGRRRNGRRGVLGSIVQVGNARPKVGLF